MNAVLDTILRTGYSKTPRGDSVKIGAHITAAEGEFLQTLIRAERPSVTLEVGLAYGVSALFICEALQEVHGQQHIVIDPAQHAGGPTERVDSRGVWMPDGVGLHNLQLAGFAGLIEFHEEPSHRALSRLEQVNRVIDFAFIDGWTTFDYKLVDFFFIDKLLRVGGVVVVRVGWTRAGMQVCRYVSSNLAYRVCGRIPDPPVAELPGDAHGLANGMVAFRKERDDSRSWEHHVEF